MQSRPMKEGRFSSEAYRQNSKEVFDYAERTGWAVVVDENDRAIMTMHIPLEDLPPLFGDDDDDDSERAVP
jgi:hypothetical protein